MRYSILCQYRTLVIRFRDLTTRFAYWILAKNNVKGMIFQDNILSIVSLVKEEVQRTSEMEGLLSNEFRHAHTYATLKKKLPHSNSRDIGLCIELVVNGKL